MKKGFSLLIILFTFFLLIISCYSDIDFVPNEVPDSPSSGNPGSRPTDPEPDLPPEPTVPVYGDDPYYMFTKSDDSKRSFNLVILDIPEGTTNAKVEFTPVNKTEGSQISFEYPIENGYLIKNNIDDERFRVGEYSIKVYLLGENQNYKEIYSLEKVNYLKELAAGNHNANLKEKTYKFELGETTEIAYKQNASDKNYSLLIGNAPYAKAVYVTPVSKATASSILSKVSDVIPYSSHGDTYEFYVNEIGEVSIPQNQTYDFSGSDEKYDSIYISYGDYYEPKTIELGKAVMAITNIQEDIGDGLSKYKISVYNAKPDENVSIKVTDRSNNEINISSINKNGVLIKDNNKTVDSSGGVDFYVDFNELYMAAFKDVDSSTLYSTSSNSQYFKFELVYNSEGTVEDKFKPASKSLTFRQTYPAFEIYAPDKNKQEFFFMVVNTPKGHTKIRINGYLVDSNYTSGNIEDFIDKKNPRFYFQSDLDTEFRMLYPAFVNNDYNSATDHLNSNSSISSKYNPPIDWGTYVFYIQYWNGSEWVTKGNSVSTVQTIKDKKPFKVEIRQELTPDTIYAPDNERNDASLIVNLYNTQANSVGSVEISMKAEPIYGQDTIMDELIHITVGNIGDISGNGTTLTESYKYFGSTGSNPTNTATLGVDETVSDQDFLKFIYDSEKDIYTFIVPSNLFGRYEFNTEVSYRGNNTSEVINSTVDVVSNAYNIVVLEGTYPPSIFAEYFLMDEEINKIPTIITLENGALYNWDFISYFDGYNGNFDPEDFSNNINRNFKNQILDTASESWAEEENRLEVGRVKNMNDYIHEIVDIAKKNYLDNNSHTTQFNFYFSDLTPELALGLVYGNGLYPNNDFNAKYSIYFLSSGSDSAYYIDRAYGNKTKLNDFNSRTNAMNNDWAHLVDIAKKIGVQNNEESYWNYYENLSNNISSYKKYGLNQWISEDELDNYDFKNDENNPILAFHMLRVSQDDNVYWYAGNVGKIKNRVEIYNNLIKIENIREANLIEALNPNRERTKVKNYDDLELFLNIFGLDYTFVSGQIKDSRTIPLLFVGKDKDYGVPNTDKESYLKEYMLISQILYPNQEHPEENDIYSYSHFYIGSYEDRIANLDVEPEVSLAVDLNQIKDGGGNWYVLDSRVLPEIYAGILLYHIYAEDPKHEPLYADKAISKRLKIVGYPNDIFSFVPNSDNEKIECSIVGSWNPLSNNYANSFIDQLDWISDEFSGDLFSIILPYGYRLEENSNYGNYESTAGKYEKAPKLDAKPNVDYFSAYFIKEIRDVNNKIIGFTDNSFERGESYKWSDITTRAYLRTFMDPSVTFGNPNEFNRIEFRFTNGELNFQNSQDIVFYNRVLKTKDKKDFDFKYIISEDSSINDELIENNPLTLKDSLSWSYLGLSNTNQVAYLERDLDYVAYADEKPKIDLFGLDIPNLRANNDGPTLNGDSSSPKNTFFDWSKVTKDGVEIGQRFRYVGKDTGGNFKFDVEFPGYHDGKGITAETKVDSSFLTLYEAQRDSGALVHGIPDYPDQEIYYLVRTGGTGTEDYNVFTVGKIENGRALILDYTATSYFYGPEGSTRIPLYYADQYNDDFDPKGKNSGDMFNGKVVRKFGDGLTINNDSAQYYIYEKPVEVRWTNDGNRRGSNNSVWRGMGDYFKNGIDKFTQYGTIVRHQYNILKIENSDETYQEKGFWYYDNNNDGCFDRLDTVINKEFLSTEGRENYFSQPFVDFYEVKNSDETDNTINFDIGLYNQSIATDKNYGSNGTEDKGQGALTITSAFNSNVISMPKDFQLVQSQNIYINGGYNNNNYTIRKIDGTSATQDVVTFEYKDLYALYFNNNNSLKAGFNPETNMPDSVNGAVYSYLDNEYTYSGAIKNRFKQTYLIDPFKDSEEFSKNLNFNSTISGNYTLVNKESVLKLDKTLSDSYKLKITATYKDNNSNEQTKYLSATVEIVDGVVSKITSFN